MPSSTAPSSPLHTSPLPMTPPASRSNLSQPHRHLPPERRGCSHRERNCHRRRRRVKDSLPSPHFNGAIHSGLCPICNGQPVCAGARHGAAESGPALAPGPLRPGQGRRRGLLCTLSPSPVSTQRPIRRWCTLRTMTTPMISASSTSSARWPASAAGPSPSQVNRSP